MARRDSLQLLHAARELAGQADPGDGGGDHDEALERAGAARLPGATATVAASEATGATLQGGAIARGAVVHMTTVPFTPTPPTNPPTNAAMRFPREGGIRTGEEDDASICVAGILCSFITRGRCLRPICPQCCTSPLRYGYGGTTARLRPTPKPETRLGQAPNACPRAPVIYPEAIE